VTVDREYRVNEMIQAPRVRVVDSRGQQLGIMSLEEALATARRFGLDLVEVAPQADPPVCRIMDYGKFKYERSKRFRRKPQGLVKEIKVRPSTDEHDLEHKVERLRRFLAEGSKVKVSLMFRGREIVHTERGRMLLDRIAERLRELGAVEQPPKLEGRHMVMILAPK